MDVLQMNCLCLATVATFQGQLMIYNNSKCNVEKTSQARLVLTLSLREVICRESPATEDLFYNSDHSLC